MLDNIAIQKQKINENFQKFNKVLNQQNNLKEFNYKFRKRTKQKIFT